MLKRFNKPSLWNGPREGVRGVGGRSFAQQVIVYKLIFTCIVIWFLSFIPFYRWKSMRSAQGQRLEIQTQATQAQCMIPHCLSEAMEHTYSSSPGKCSKQKWVGQPTKLIKILHAKQSDKWTDKGQAVWPANDREANKSKIKFGIFFETFTQHFHNNKIRHFPEGTLQSSYINY